MDDATTQSQLKDKELAELQAGITCALRLTCLSIGCSETYLQ